MNNEQLISRLLPNYSMMTCVKWYLQPNSLTVYRFLHFVLFSLFANWLQQLTIQLVCVFIFGVWFGEIFGLTALWKLDFNEIVHFRADYNQDLLQQILISADFLFI